MTVRGVLSVAVALVAASVPAAPARSGDSSDKQAPRCAGRVATVVGTTGTVRGTPGRDVIVANGRTSRVLAGDGDDLICVRSRARSMVEIHAGGGDDRVLVQRWTQVSASLGGGDDTFLGGPGPDWVSTSLDVSTPGTFLYGPGRDTVRTRGGDDSVTSGFPGHANRDDVRLGDGDDGVQLSGSVHHTRARISGGPGEDVVSVTTEQMAGGATGPPAARGALVVDATKQAATLGGRAHASWRGFEGYYLDSDRRQVFLGSEANEEVGFGGSGAMEARLAGGDDEIRFGWLSFSSARPPVLDGGPGTDLLGVGVLEQLTRASLVTGRLDATSGGTVTGFDFHAFEDLSVLYNWNGMGLPGRSRIELTGDAGPNRLQADACDVVLHGGAGDDHLRVGDDPSVVGLTITSSGADGCRGTSQVLGQEGDDVLVSMVRRSTLSGSPGLNGVRTPPRVRELPVDDLLDGGEGNDTADGGAGQDTCVAEQRTRCEA